MKRLSVVAVVALVAVCAGAETCTWTGAAGDGLFQSPGNWDPEYSDPGVSDTLNYKIPASGEETVKLTSNLYSAYFNVSSDEGATGRAVIDLDGNELWVTNGSRMTFSNPMPVVFSNGSIRTWCRYKWAGQSTVSEYASVSTSGSKTDVTFDHVVFNFSNRTSPQSTADEQFITCRNSFMTNYPYESVGSNTHIVFDNTTYYLGKNWQLHPVSDATNVTVRFTNKAKISYYGGTYTLGDEAHYENCRLIVDDGARIGYRIYTSTSAGVNNTVAFSNAIFTSTLNLRGTNSAAYFHNTTYDGTGDGVGVSLKGTGNRVVFSGDTELKFKSLDFEGGSVSNAIVYADGTHHTNTSHYVGITAGVRDCLVEVGENVPVRMSTISARGATGSVTNLTLRVKKGGVMYLSNRQDAAEGAPYSMGGPGFRLVLDNGTYFFRSSKETQYPCCTYVGGSIEFNGDDARMKVGDEEYTGYIQLGLSSSAHSEDDRTRLVYNPGPDGYHGEAPLYTRVTKSSSFGRLAVEVNAKAWIGGRDPGTYRLPLFKAGSGSVVGFVTETPLTCDYEDAKLVVESGTVYCEIVKHPGLMILVR